MVMSVLAYQRLQPVFTTASARSRRLEPVGEPRFEVDDHVLSRGSAAANAASPE